MDTSVETLFDESPLSLLAELEKLRTENIQLQDRIQTFEETENEMSEVSSLPTPQGATMFSMENETDQR